MFAALHIRIFERHILHIAVLREHVAATFELLHIGRKFIFGDARRKARGARLIDGIVGGAVHRGTLEIALCSRGRSVQLFEESVQIARFHVETHGCDQFLSFFRAPRERD